MHDDEVAFTAYVHARRDAVRRAAYLLCGDWYWADDLTQSVFIRLATHWKRIRDQEALHGWVRVSLLRAYLSENRRVWRRREQQVVALPEPAGTRDAADEAGLQLMFENALRRLSPRQRATVLCRYYHGLDVAQTAAALRCSPGTVKSQTARALSTLRELLAPQLVDEWAAEGDGSKVATIAYQPNSEVIP